MRDLPRGTVTLLFTDIEGSTRLLQDLGRDRYVEALTIHRNLLRDAFTRNGGVEVEMQGDSFHFSFATARAAVQAAAAGQRALASYDWSTEPIKVRIGLHTGEPVIADDLYAGLDVHRAARVMSAAHGGQVLLSSRTADLVADEAPDGVGLRDLGEHRLKDLLEPQRLYQLTGVGLSDEFPPPKTLPRATTNLPVVQTPLIGRDRELAELTDVLASGAVRVVTVTGPGGTGKTRLALQAAAELVDCFPDGVIWVPLAGLRDADLVVPSVAQVLGTQGELANALGGRELLAVLDNLEHLVAAAGALADLLSAAPQLRLLVTSRSPLRIDAEYEYPLDPLLDDGAVALFLDRARRAGARLDATETVRSVCRRLDNLPLALELAAGRAKLLGTDALLARLDRSLPLLTGGRRDLPERQQTLRATIQWSYELLPEESRMLFARLSVFGGTFSLEAAEDVCGATLDTIAELTDLSLLKPATAGRFLMLQTVREYAVETLEEQGATDALRDAHAHFFLSFAEDGEARLWSAEQAEVLEQLEREHDNLRAALDHLHMRAPELELRLAGALQDFWLARGHVVEGGLRIESALRGAPEAPAGVRAKALEGAAYVAHARSDYEAAERLGEECLVLARATGNEARIVSALGVLGAAAKNLGRYERARPFLEEAVEVARSTGDSIRVAHALGNISDLALNEGAFDVAAASARECVELAEASGDSWTVGTGLVNLGHALQQRNEEASLGYLARALELARAIGARPLLSLSVLAVGAALVTKHPRQSARLVGAAQAALDDLQMPLPPFERKVHERTLESLSDGLGTDELERLLREGGELDLEAAAGLAFELATREGPAARGDRSD